VSTRRGFLQGALGLGGVAALGASAPGCVRWVDPAPYVDVPAPVNGKIALDLSQYPDLAPPGSALTLRPAGGTAPVLVVHWPDGSYTAHASTCTHAGCPVGFNEGAIECPCHGARFGHDGKVLNPPAVQGLATHAASIDPTTRELVVDLAGGGTAGFPAVVGGKVFFPFADFPQLQTAGGSAAGTPAGLGRPMAVVNLGGGQFSAVDTTCTHLACTVDYDPASSDFHCPCHGSTFTLQGVVTKAPATRNLTSYAVTSDATGVTVTVA